MAKKGQGLGQRHNSWSARARNEEVWRSKRASSRRRKVAAGQRSKPVSGGFFPRPKSKELTSTALLSPERINNPEPPLCYQSLFFACSTVPPNTILQTVRICPTTSIEPCIRQPNRPQNLCCHYLEPHVRACQFCSLRCLFLVLPRPGKL